MKTLKKCRWRKDAISIICSGARKRAPEKKRFAQMKKPIRVSRGYRLLPKTHKKILKIQELFGFDPEEAISTVCKFYLKHNKGTVKNESFKNNPKSI